MHSVMQLRHTQTSAGHFVVTLANLGDCTNCALSEQVKTSPSLWSDGQSQATQPLPSDLQISTESSSRQVPTVPAWMTLFPVMEVFVACNKMKRVSWRGSMSHAGVMEGREVGRWGGEVGRGGGGEGGRREGGGVFVFA